MPDEPTPPQLVLYAVVGEESRANLRLFETLKTAFGRQQVRRLLELQHVRECLAQASSQPVVVCLDLFSFDLPAVTDALDDFRDDFPKAVFTLYLDKDEYARRRNELPGNWATRLDHYYKLYREADDVEYEPMVRASLRAAQYEAVYNMGGTPVRLTPSARKGLVGDASAEPDLSHTVFLSYSRRDWDGFVQDLVRDLADGAHKVWLDQDYILGGDDWMDAVGAALQECDTLLLVLSPEAINSKYVKMEYRYFFRQEKPIIPILYRKVDIPFELATLHYLDFTGDWRPTSLENLRRILSRRQAR
jgi:hypothetical protein